MMNIKKILFVNFIMIVFIILLIEIFFYIGRYYLGKNSVGFLINFNSTFSKILKNDCVRMKTNLILSHQHDTKNGCEVLGSYKTDDHFIYYKNNSENLKSLKILTLGGSTTDGYFKMFSNSNTWPYLLSKICNIEFNCEVVNGAVGGYSSSQELLKYLLYADLFKGFDFVVSLNGINEINLDRGLKKELRKEYPYYTKLQFFMSKSEKWIKQNKNKITLLPNVISFVKYAQQNNNNINIVDLVQKNKLEGNEKKKNYDNLDFNSNLWKKNISYLNSLSNNDGIKFINFLQPTMGLDHINIQWLNKSSDFAIHKNFMNSQTKIDTNYIYIKLRKICANLEYCVDISHIAQPGGLENLFSNARHHNQKGNLIIANEIYKILKKKLVY